MGLHLAVRVEELEGRGALAGVDRAEGFGAGSVVGHVREHGGKRHRPHLKRYPQRPRACARTPPKKEIKTTTKKTARTKKEKKRGDQGSSACKTGAGF